MASLVSSSKFLSNIKYLIYLYVFIGFNLALSSSYDDFFKAIEFDEPVAVQQLLLRGFDPNTPTADLQTPLILAIQKGSFRVSQVLLSSPQLQVNRPNPSDETPLMLAALKQQEALVKGLIRRGADINRPGWTPLHYAATTGHVGIIRLLLEHHAYIDTESPNGTTPLMMAAFYGTPEATKLLLEEGADPLLKNQQGLTALDFATNGPHKESVALIAAFSQAAQARALEVKPAAK
jgi:ankyrin repeat protein